MSIRCWLRQTRSHSSPVFEEQVLAVSALYMAGMPLGLFDGVDCWMLEGPMRDAQLVEPAQQLDPIGHDGGPYGQTRIRHQRALLEMSPGVICGGGSVSTICCPAGPLRQGLGR